MMMRGIRLDLSECAKIECALAFIIIISTILHQKAVISLCFALSFVVLMAYTLYQTAVVGTDASVLALVYLAVMNVLINAFISGKLGVSFDYLKKVIMFSAFVLFMHFSCLEPVNKDVAKYILWLPCIAGIILILSYYFGGNTRTIAGGITLSFSNPNFAGMWLFHISVFFFVLGVSPGRSILFRISCFLFYAILVKMILLTKTRSCMIGVVLFLALCFAGLFWKNRIVAKPGVILFITILPIVVVFIYSTLLSSDLFLRMFEFVSSEGKGLDSRLGVWSPAIEALKKNFLFGDYYGISDGTGMSQMHNTHLDVICSYGVIPFIMFLRLLYNCIFQMTQKPYCYENYCALCGFLSVVVLGIFEAAVVAGSMGLNILTVVLLILSNRTQMRNA